MSIFPIPSLEPKQVSAVNQDVSRHLTRESSLKKWDFWLTLLIPALLLLPTLLWTLVDRYPIISDSSRYGRMSIDLYRALRVSPGAWWDQLLPIAQNKAQGAAWFGQFFVPLGIRLGSIDRGLMISILVTQWASLALFYRVIRRVGAGPLLGFLGCLVLASTPLFIASSQSYMVEPLQTLAAIWFLWIMVSARRWSRFMILAQLMGAGILAILAKVISPMFSILPGLAALIIAFRSGPDARPWGWKDLGAWLTLLAVLPLGVVTVVWYRRNFVSVWNFARAASTGSVASFWEWGKEDTFLNTLGYWVGALGRAFFIQYGFLALTVILLVAALLLYFRQGQFIHFDGLFYLILILQVALVLVIFSTASNRSSRYLMPVLPCLPVLLCLLLSRLQRPVLNALFIAVFTLQFGLLQAQAWGVQSTIQGSYLRVVERNNTANQLLEWVVDFTCSNSGKPILNVIGTEIVVEKFWLTQGAANYVVARNFYDISRSKPCQFTWFADNYFAGTAEESWSFLLAAKIEYVIIPDPKIYPPTRHTPDRALFPENLPVLIDLLDNGGRYERAGTLPGDPGILIYKRIHK